MSEQQYTKWKSEAAKITVDLHREIVLEIVHQLAQDNQAVATSKFASNRLSPGPFSRSNLLHSVKTYIERITNFETREITLNDPDAQGQIELRFVSTWAR